VRARIPTKYANSWAAGKLIEKRKKNKDEGKIDVRRVKQMQKGQI
jgi:hypothetical protein